MSMGQTLYRTATRAAEPFLGIWLRHRARTGKEDGDRLPERFARSKVDLTPSRLVWMHGASIGETRLLIEVARQLSQERPELHFLFTSQTRTAGELISRAIENTPELTTRSRYQLAPIDTPAVAARFIDNWQPRLCVFAEGDVWPNLVSEAHSRSIPTALINARMTSRSINGWRRWRSFAAEVFSKFDILLAADSHTAVGLSDLAQRPVVSAGNLKLSLSVSPPSPEDVQAVRSAFTGGRACLVAVSTHEGEEAWVLDAIEGIEPRPCLILIPRHPERRSEIIEILDQRSLSYSVRSRGEVPSVSDEVLLCDTLGEVSLFASVADSVYLGGGHAEGVGGHNPVEIFRLGKPVFSGPDVFNFEDLVEELRGDPAFRIVRTQEELRSSFPLPDPSQALRANLEAQAHAPMAQTLSALTSLLEPTA